MSDLSFGAWLRQRRRSHDLTQVELAKQAGCAVGTLRNIESDDARPSKQLAARLARILGVADEDVARLVAFARGSEAAPATPVTLPKLPEASAVEPLPPPSPAQRARANLPAQLTRLIGREREVDAVRALLLRPDVHLVTLTGPGGTGKTRVAVHVAAELQDTFTDGIVFVDLAAVTSPDLVLVTVAQTLGVQEGSAQPLRSRLATALHDQSLLLLLDNFEQVVEAAPIVAELMLACPQLKVIITSRITLGLAGEYEWPMPPLALPDSTVLPSFEQLSRYESVRLFIERGHAANPQFTLTSSNASAVVEICHRLDGLPLAIELAAARVKVFQPQALLTRLDRRLTFLTGGGHDRPMRQQTMRNTIAWSYHLLAPDEQQLFQRLGVFVGGGTLAAIKAVCNDDDVTNDLTNLVAALVNHSLLRRLPPTPDVTNSAAEPRFGMLETLREYALEQLGASSDSDAVRQRHARYFTALAKTTAVAWNTPLINAAIAQQRREHDNMRVALQWACDHGDGLLGLQLATELWGFWRSYGYTSEGRAWFARLLQLNEHASDHVAMSEQQRGLQAAAWLASDQHDFATATRLFEESMTLRRALGETEGTELLINAARQARTVGHYQQATALLEDALTHHRPADNTISVNSDSPGISIHERGQVLRELALVLRERGDFVRAIALLEACLTLYYGSADRVSIALVQLGLGDIARDQGDGARVQEHCEPSLAVFRESNMQWAIGFALNNLALAAYLQGDLARAITLVNESLTVFRELQADASRAEVLITQGKILRAQNNQTTAYAAFIEALQIAWVLGPRLLVVDALEGLASVMDISTQADRVVQVLATASALRHQMGTPIRLVDQTNVDQVLAMARAYVGDDGLTKLWTEAQALPLEHTVSIFSRMPAFDSFNE